MAAVEAALRARKLDRTLTTALPVPGYTETAVAGTAVESLDRCLGGGLPRGQLSEIVGPRSSGRTALLLQLLAAATERGELVAIVDTYDCLDVASVAAAGVALDRLLWVRGRAAPLSLADQAIERALKALNLVLQARGFGVVAIDATDVPIAAVHRLPFTTWLRIQRTIEGSDTACVLLGTRPLARSAGGLTLSLTGHPQWDGAAGRSRRLAGTEITVRVISPRRRLDAEVVLRAVPPDERSSPMVEEGRSPVLTRRRAGLHGPPSAV